MSHDCFISFEVFSFSRRSLSEIGYRFARSGMESLDKLLVCLNSTSDFLERQSLLTDICADIQASSKDDFDSRCQFICSSRFLDTLTTVMRHSSSAGSHNGLHKCIILVSELAKSESVRHALERFLPFLSEMLPKMGLVSSDEGQLYDCLRAIGNICYENDSGRKIFLESNGLPHLLSATKAVSDLKDVEPKETFKLVKTAVGCLCNVIDSNDPCQKAAIDCGFIALLQQLVDDSFYTDLHSTVLACFVILVEHVESSKEFVHPGMIKKVLLMLQVEDQISMENALDLLVKISEFDGAKAIITENGALRVLLKLLEREDLGSGIREECSKWLVELSVGAKVPESDALSCEVEIAARWLAHCESAETSQRTTAALFLGNLMRDRQSCLRMIKNSAFNGQTVAEILKNVLTESVELMDKICGDDLGKDLAQCQRCREPTRNASERTEESGDADANGEQNCENCSLIRQRKNILELQYAVVSALKNLSVPEEVRRIMMNDLNFGETLLLAVTHFGKLSCGPVRSPVLNKLLALARMFISVDERAAVYFGTCDSVIEQLFSWVKEATVSNYALLAVITAVKSSNYSREVVNFLLQKGFIHLLTALMVDKHLSLTLSALGAISVCFSNAGVVEMFLENPNNHELLSALNVCLQDSRIPPEGIVAGLQIVESLTGVQKFAHVVLRSGIPATVATLRNSPHEEVRKKAAQLDTFL